MNIGFSVITMCFLGAFQSNTKNRDPGFSVAFGSTGCSGSVGGRAPFAPLARTLRAGSTSSWGSPGAYPPGTFVKLESLKCNFRVPWTGVE